MPANLDAVPVVFEAAADAPRRPARSASLHRRPRRPEARRRPERASSRASTWSSACPGQSVYWKHDVDRAAVAVTEEVPFKISIVEPKVPLVQNGSMNLKIVAERKPGFKGPITIYPLFNPPGVGSAHVGDDPAKARPKRSCR